jgi:hypothetical protein
MYGFRNDNAEPKHQAPFIAQRKMKRILSIIVTCVFPLLGAYRSFSKRTSSLPAG